MQRDYQCNQDDLEYAPLKIKYQPIKNEFSNVFSIKVLINEF